MYSVYRFINKENEILYVGYTENLKSRICAEHFYGNSHLSRDKITQVHKVEFIQFETYHEAAFHEYFYFKLYKPIFNNRNIINRFNKPKRVKNNWQYYCTVENGKIIDINECNDDGMRSLQINIPKWLKDNLRNLSKKNKKNLNYLIFEILRDNICTEMEIQNDES